MIKNDSPITIEQFFLAHFEIDSLLLRLHQAMDILIRYEGLSLDSALTVADSYKFSEEFEELFKTVANRALAENLWLKDYEREERIWRVVDLAPKQAPGINSIVGFAQYFGLLQSLSGAEKRRLRKSADRILKQDVNQRGDALSRTLPRTLLEKRPLLMHLAGFPLWRSCGVLTHGRALEIIKIELRIHLVELVQGFAPLGDVTGFSGRLDLFPTGDSLSTQYQDYLKTCDRLEYTYHLLAGMEIHPGYGVERVLLRRVGLPKDEDEKPGDGVREAPVIDTANKTSAEWDCDGKVISFETHTDGVRDGKVAIGIDTLQGELLAFLCSEHSRGALLREVIRYLYRGRMDEDSVQGLPGKLRSVMNNLAKKFEDAQIPRQVLPLVPTTGPQLEKQSDLPCMLCVCRLVDSTENTQRIESQRTIFYDNERESG